MGLGIHGGSWSLSPTRTKGQLKFWGESKVMQVFATEQGSASLTPRVVQGSTAFDAETRNVLTRITG